ncbi:MAG: MATE family efflux transporter [Bacteroidetes bacterium]|nr:MAG: MATE family efflux transporter [Bacteroidota bacterium]
MKQGRSEELGTRPIRSLLVQQAVPASIGILILSVYGIVDTIFVGRWVGSMGIAAITVVMPITFLIASIGMSIGVGGASIISRALGGGQRQRALLAFGNQVSLTLLLAVSVVLLGSFFQEEILMLFGGKGDIMPPARIYFRILLLGVPFLAWAMMSNNVIRAEGKPRVAMYTLVTPAVANIVLDPIFIVGFDMGIAGAAWATTLSYMASATYALLHFLGKKAEMKLLLPNFRLQWPIVREIFAIGGVTLARQGTISILAIVLNNTLFRYGGELSVSVYGIINRVMMFANFPVLGITQGFVPIAGYNYGAEKWDRVRKTLKTAITAGTGLAFIIFAGIMLFTTSLVAIFTREPGLLTQTPPSLRIAFLATPLLAVQLISSAYFQAVGKAWPALFLALTKQGFCLIPLLLILPLSFGLDGIWWAFPIADTLSALICFSYLRYELNKNLPALSKEQA